jgi:hypothetical protein
MKSKDFLSVIHLHKCDKLNPQEKEFLSGLFQLKTTDELNINSILIDQSFVTRIKRSFGNKPHKLLIFYESPIKLNYVNNDFIQIRDSIDNKTEFDRLNKDEKYLLIGNSKIGKLEAKQTKKINQLIDSRPLKYNKSKHLSQHHKDFHNRSKYLNINNQYIN